MNYCPKCKIGVSTEKKQCPNCGEKLIIGAPDDAKDNNDELGSDELVAVMTALGLF